MHSKTDEERLAEALLTFLGRRVTGIRRKQPGRTPYWSPEEVSDPNVDDVRLALASLGLCWNMDDGDELMASRRLMVYLLETIGARVQEDSRQPSPELLDVLREAEGSVVAPWFEDPEDDTRPDPAPRTACEAAACETATQAPEYWHPVMRQALLGDLEQEEAVRLIRRLRSLVRTGRSTPRSPRPVRADAETDVHRFHDPLLLRAARPILGMLDQLARELPSLLRPLLVEIRNKFHESGYRVGELRRTNDWRLRQLREELGLPASRLIQELRMELAMHMLRDTSRTVKQVARATGYKSTRNLRMLSGDWCGLSPSRLRTRLKSLDLESLPEEAFSWLFLEKCRRGEVPAEKLRPVIEHLEYLYGPLV